MLTAKAKITDQQLEPDDETRFVVTVHNSSPVATANKVVVGARLNGAACTGVDLRPAHLDFGSIPPRSRVTKEFMLNTRKAPPRDYQVKFDMKYESATPTHECDEESFQVVPD